MSAGKGTKVERRKRWRPDEIDPMIAAEDAEMKVTDSSPPPARSRRISAQGSLVVRSLPAPPCGGAPITNAPVEPPPGLPHLGVGFSSVLLGPSHNGASDAPCVPVMLASPRSWESAPGAAARYDRAEREEEACEAEPRARDGGRPRARLWDIPRRPRSLGRGNPMEMTAQPRAASWLAVSRGWVFGDSMGPRRLFSLAGADLLRPRRTFYVGIDRHGSSGSTPIDPADLPTSRLRASRHVW